MALLNGSCIHHREAKILLGQQRLTIWKPKILNKTAYMTDGEKLYACSLEDGDILNTASAETDITKLLCKDDATIIAYCEGAGVYYKLEDNEKR